MEPSVAMTTSFLAFGSEDNRSTISLL